MIKKAEHLIEGQIDTLAFGGDGIMRHEGRVVFVPFSAPDDLVSVKIIHQKKNFARGSIQKIIQSSSYRTAVKCGHFGTCGGCQLQHINYPKQGVLKQSFVKDALARIGKIDTDVLETRAAAHQWYYRRHIRLHWQNGELGFMGEFLDVVPIKQCPIFDENAEIMDLLKNICPLLKSTRAVEISVYKAEPSRFVLSFQLFEAIKNSHTLFEKALADTDLIQGIMWQIEGRHSELGNCSLSFILHGLSLVYNPKVFVQAHPEQSAALYDQLCVLAKQIKAKRVLDLFCGFGASSILLRREGMDVEAIELNPESIRLARENEKNNGIEGIKWHAADVDAVADLILRGSRFDTVLVNPPRTGLSSTLTALLLKHRPEHILYVSCMPATLARDSAALKAGYKIHYCQPYDMFPQTTHVESLVLFIKN